jgi:tRNA(Ile)-lysidine synthetase-like protein
LTSPPTDLDHAIASVPPGRWAVAVSGGADSVALLLLLARHRPDLSLHVVHLDHETRGGASADDARFVRDLAARLGIDCTTETRAALESTLDRLEPNLSARFRAARLALFRRVVDERGLAGVLLAHQADDQAETILHRLLRGSGPSGLAGMSVTTRVGGVLLYRPLLGIRRDVLRAVLRDAGEPWREDASNESSDYLRNRLRRLLSREPTLTDALLRLGRSSRELRDWVHAHTPEPNPVLRTVQLLDLADPLRRELARRWLVGAGVPEDRIDPVIIARLLTMAEDAASSPRRHFPGKVLVRRSRGALSAAGRDRH